MPPLVGIMGQLAWMAAIMAVLVLGQVASSSMQPPRAAREPRVPLEAVRPPAAHATAGRRWPQPHPAGERHELERWRQFQSQFQVPGGEPLQSQQSTRQQERLQHELLPELQSGQVGSPPESSSVTNAGNAKWLPSRRILKRKCLASCKENYVLLYELYHNDLAYPFLHSSQPYRPMSLHPGFLRPGSSDVNVSASFSILFDDVYRRLLCEYAAVFFIDSKLADVQGSTPWLGFQSWRATDKGFALSRKAFDHLVSDIKDRKWYTKKKTPEGGTNFFYFWATVGVKDMYGFCETVHRGCQQTLSRGFRALFSAVGLGRSGWPAALSLSGSAGNGTEAGPGVHRTAAEFLPPLPVILREYSHCSYWVMHAAHFPKFAAFARAFFVIMEEMHHLHLRIARCPLHPGRERCWAYLLERVVNVWAYHSGMRMMWLNTKTGQVEEQFPLSERTDMWTHWFGDEALEALRAKFPCALSHRAKILYSKLGGPAPQC